MDNRILFFIKTLILKLVIVFSISLNEKDRDILSLIQNFFLVGVIYNQSSSKNSLKYIVKSLNDLQIIIDHFV